MSNVIRIGAARIPRGGFHVQGDTSVLQPSPSSSPTDNDLLKKLLEAIITVGVNWLVDLLKKSATGVELTDIQLQQTGANQYVIVDAKVKHRLTVKIHSEWEAETVVFVGQQPFRHKLKGESKTFEHDITGPGSLAIHIFPLSGKPIEIIGNVSFDVTCDLFLEDGSHVASFRRNGWEPKGKDIQSDIFHYI